jgi:hypothetical protein
LLQCKAAASTEAAKLLTIQPGVDASRLMGKLRGYQSVMPGDNRVKQSFL